MFDGVLFFVCVGRRETTMAETVELIIEKRTERGTRQTQRLRKQGKLPGVVYGHKQETFSVSCSQEELTWLIRHGTHVVDLKLDGTPEQVLIRDVQWDHLGKEILHVDFIRVSKDERIEVPVRIEIKGVSPGVTAGGILEQPRHTLTVECLAISIPESVRVNINELQLGASVHVKDLTVPEGVKILDDPDAIVVHIASPEAEAEAGPAPSQAEPEVIGRQKEEEAGEE
jgi:large subunit ribosomal protein L25